MSPRDLLTHAPVLLNEAVDYLAVQPGGRYVDCTTGAAGHARAILEAAAPGGLLLGLDADPAAISVARENLAQFGDSVQLVESNFRDLRRVCRRQNFIPVHGILFDLGISSMQLADERGFSFQVEAPLDMRFNPGQALTAADIVNHYTEHDLADVIWRFGEDPASRRIARAVIRARPLRTTTELAAVIARASGGPRRRIHPATRTFQSLRIAVNDELGALRDALSQAVEVLGRGGRIVVISFHSLEDRIVKQFFVQESRDCICPPEQPTCTCGHRASLRLVTRRSVTPSPEEIAVNPRSRSARLRAAEKLGETP
ncbi:MAG TPA: 16S rRNA (cytosine(1402)-N(4))-methyltransferase RsmH [Dehalococcoidia bacterium]|nr:16S rRNA (cytosine(1402)-N(4))-methyltransferase RsmH [Dehalococcoidia bacterium]